MADTTYLPTLDETRFLKFYNAGAALGANLVLVPDATAERAARLPTAGEVIKEIVGVTFRAVPTLADGDVVALAGDVARCTAYGTISKGDRVYVSSTAAHLGQVAKYTGSVTNGAQFILGVAQHDAADGSAVSVRLAPHRVAEGRQFGRATLSAGTVTVSGVVISATTCNIRVSCNTPGGTQGYLSAPAASRSTAGTFVINSSTNADTSTVDWEVIDDAA